MPADTVVRGRIGIATKERASTALEAMGLSISDAIRLLMLRIADGQRLPFEVKVPNAATRRAIAELEQGRGKRFDSPVGTPLCRARRAGYVTTFPGVEAKRDERYP